MEACRKNIYLTEQYQYTYLMNSTNQIIESESRGGSRGGAPGAPPPPKIGKNRIFCVKSLFFTRNAPKCSRLPPLGAIFLSAPPP